MGRLESEVLRDGPAGAPGDGVVWYSVGVSVGWRVELGFSAAAEGAARPAKAGEAR